MPKLQIKNSRTNIILYEGVFATVKDCLEQAVQERVCLDYADLRHANLANGELDDIIMRHARLDFANLSGVNLSEAQLNGTNFSFSTMVAACLCYSSLDNCNFTNTRFGATDLVGGSLQKGRFSGLSAFTLPFIETEKLDNCIYRTSNGMPCPFSKPPLILQGRDFPVIFLDQHLKIGMETRTYCEWFSPLNDNIPSKIKQENHPYHFFQEHRSLLFDLYQEENFRSQPENRPTAVLKQQ